MAHIELAQEQGADFGIMYHFGDYPPERRNLVAGMMPYDNANDLILQKGGEILPHCREFPVLASVCATDPFRLIDRHLNLLKQYGYAGVHNYPSVCFVDGDMRASLESNDSGFKREIDMIHASVGVLDIRCAFAFSEREAWKMAEAGSELIVLHFGIVTKRQLREGSAPDLESCVALARRVGLACHRVNPEVMILCCGQQLENAENVEAMFAWAPEIDGCLDLSCLSDRSVEEKAQRIHRLSGWRQQKNTME